MRHISIAIPCGPIAFCQSENNDLIIVLVHFNQCLHQKTQYVTLGGRRQDDPDAKLVSTYGQILFSSVHSGKSCCPHRRKLPLLRVTLVRLSDGIKHLCLTVRPGADLPLLTCRRVDVMDNGPIWFSSSPAVGFESQNWRTASL